MADKEELKIRKDNKLESTQSQNVNILPLSEITVTFPPTPVKGKLAYNTMDNVIYYADGTIWRPLVGGGSIFLGGDVIGPVTNTTVIRINGQPFPAGTVTGQVLQFHQHSNSWILNSNTPPAAGQTLVWNGTNWLPTTIAGDVTGPITNTVVVSINGQSFPPGTVTGQVLQFNQALNQWELNSNTPPASGQTLVWNGTNWLPTTIAGDVTGPITNTVVNSINGQTFPPGTVTGQVIQFNQPLNQWQLNSNTPPSPGQTLVWSGANWIPSSISVTPVANSITAVYPLLGGNGLPISPPTANTAIFSSTQPLNIIQNVQSATVTSWFGFAPRYLVTGKWYFEASQTVAGGNIIVTMNLKNEYAALGVPWGSVTWADGINAAGLPGSFLASPPSSSNTWPMLLGGQVTTNTGQIAGVTFSWPQPVDATTWWRVAVSVPATLTYYIVTDFNYTT